MIDVLSHHYKVLGIGTPIIDQIVNVSDDYMINLSGAKGGSTPVDYETFLALIQTSGQPPSFIVGGSMTNTIKGLARLGRNCAIFGKIGKDAAGKIFQEHLNELGITPLLLLDDLPTAQVACLISPDQERTMRSFLGAGANLRDEELTPELFVGVQLVHIEGYILSYNKLTLRAMELAKQAGAKVSFDLSSFEITQQHKKTIIELASKYIDILFANEEEAEALTGLNAERSCLLLKDLCEIAVVKMGKKGSWSAHRDKKSYQSAFDVKTFDTTGAGDLFASGFLHGFLSNKSLEECSRYGALIASNVVQFCGADIPPENWQEIRKELLPRNFSFQ